MRKCISPFILMVLVSGCVLSACAYKRPPGQWLMIDAPGIVFSGVELNADAIDLVYPDLCVDAQNEIRRQLTRRLPAQIKPFEFDVPQENKRTDAKTPALQLIITKCEIDVTQWNGSFTFYLTLNMRVVLKNNGEAVLSYRMETYEQVQTDVPTPLFDYTFEEPVARTLIFFDNGRVWVPHEN